MAEELPSLHIDTDWKKQAQQEKKRLAEQAEQAKQKAAVPAGPAAHVVTGAGLAPPPAAAASVAAGPQRRDRGSRELPPASVAGLVNMLMTQTLLYLGDLAPRGSEGMLNLDMAKHQIDLLGVLEDKTRNNLTDEEQHALDSALFETRRRFVDVASQFIS